MIGSEVEAATLSQAFAALRPTTFDGAQVHLRRACDQLSKGQFAKSVENSIESVESVARVLTGESKGTLKQALNKLNNALELHPAFKQGLEKLYGFTSGEHGIRHSQLGAQSKVDEHDALFMLGACASFVTYLVGKGRAAGLIPDRADVPDGHGP